MTRHSRTRAVFDLRRSSTRPAAAAVRKQRTNVNKIVNSGTGRQPPSLESGNLSCILFNKSDLISTPLGKEMKIGLSSLVPAQGGSLVGLSCRARVNYRGYAVAVHRRLCYPHVTSAAVYIYIYIRGPGLLDERAEDLPH